MAIPTYEDLMLPFLTELSDGTPRYVRDLVATLSDVFNLSAEDRELVLPSGQQRAIANRVGWARTYLKKAGLITSPTRGIVEISELGRQLLQEKPARVDHKLLTRFDSFQEFIKGTTKTDAPEKIATSQQTPEEIIEDAYAELQDRLASDLLDTVKGCSPYFFEKVVLRLLQTMGYGGVSGSGMVTPPSGDGGIDGIIYEDKLGLDVVCIQAKRWEGTVGRPAVQSFVGSMDLHRSRKGVILTTGKFSPDAINYVDRIEGKKVVLIGGDELCRLMIEHGVGVTPRRTYQLLDISQDFFDENEE